MLTVKDYVNIHLVKGETTTDKYTRRKMASTSVRNLVSHLAEISNSNFRLVPEKWACPKKLPIDYTSLIK